jgi:hypothetical protein
MHVTFIPNIDARNAGSLDEWGQIEIHGWTPPQLIPPHIGPEAEP